MEKGFIGAIGDDLPSLVPIVIALLLFFLVFGAALTTYNTQNSDLRERIETLSVARVLKGNSLLPNAAQFEENCAKAKLKPRPYSFVAAVFQADHPIDEIAAYNDGGDIIGFSEEYMKGRVTDPGDEAYDSDNPDREYFCQYLRVGAREFTGNEPGYVIRFYPVAIQTRDSKDRVIIMPGVMAMVIW